MTIATTEIQKTPLSNFRDLLEKMRPQIMLAAAKHLDADRVLRVMLTTVQQTPELLNCTRESVLGSLMLCTQLGLEPDGRNAAMVPFKTTCTLVVGYPGMIELALRSGKITNIEARVVREGDEFDYAYGTSPFITHKPSPKHGKVTHAYAVAYFTSGATQFDVMDRSELDTIQARVKAKKGPWSDQDHADEMRRKSPVRRLFKYLPSSPEISAAIAANDAVELGTPQALPPVDVLPMLDEQPESQASAIEDELCGPEARQPPAPAPDPPPAETSAPEPADTPPKAVETITGAQYAELDKLEIRLDPADRLAFRNQMGIESMDDLKTLPASEYQDVFVELNAAHKLPDKARPTVYEVGTLAQPDPSKAARSGVADDTPAERVTLTGEQFVDVETAYHALGLTNAGVAAKKKFRAFALLGTGTSAFGNLAKQPIAHTYDELMAELGKLKAALEG